MPDIAENISRIETTLKQRLVSLGRREDDCLLVGVTKTHPAEAVCSALQAGILDIGENKVQEATQKLPELSRLAPDSPYRFHFIGHLQSNKVKALLRLKPFLIHSVDSFRLASAISEQSETPSDILIQVNTSGEASKSGLEPEIAQAEIMRIAELKRIRIMGLMTIGLLAEEPEAARPGFRMLKELFDDLAKTDHPRLRMRYLSMGMTDDYLIALEEGSNLVRIGSAIFGNRNYGGK